MVAPIKLTVHSCCYSDFFDFDHVYTRMIRVCVCWAAEHFHVMFHAETRETSIASPATLRPMLSK